MNTNSFNRDQVTLMIKPVGAMCNLRCTYCYYLPTLALFGGHERRMTIETLEHIFAGYLPSAGPHVTIAWQGGEPTLAGLDFFRQAVEIQQRYARPNQQIHNALQTNGTLLDKDWSRFLHEYQFLVGLSLDGPQQFHDHYRIDSHGKGSSDATLNAITLLRHDHVEFNVLCVLNDRNVHHPDELLGFILNRRIGWIQFIPAIEWEDDPETGEFRLAPYSPSGSAYGKFLCRVFDLWFERHRHWLSVRFFDSVLMKLVRNEMPFCILSGSCHSQLTIEHDGSVFGCDHFVSNRWRLGQVESDEWFDGLNMDRLLTFSARKQDLPQQCQVCQWRNLCYGGCPKHRAHRGDVPEPTVLCEGYRMFYAHAMDRLEWLAGYLRRGMQPPPPGSAENRTQAALTMIDPFYDAPRNAPCPCGSGLKFKRCHGRSVS